MNMAAPSRDLLRRFSKSEVEEIAFRIVNDGFACVDDVFSVEEVQQARAQAIRAVDDAHGEYAAHVGCEGLEGRILAGLSSSASFVDLCHRLCRAQGIYAAPGAPGRQVLRCLSGASGLKHSYYFHFDSFELTVLAPIAIPSGSRAGDLLIFPNFRRRRSSYLLNTLEKFVIERSMVQAFIKREALRSPYVTRLQLRPGNLYFFNGNRSLHGNEEADPDLLRATLLIHFAETHHDHWMRRLRQRTRRT